MSKERKAKPIYELNHEFKHGFSDVGIAFWCKYKKENGYNTITIADIRQVGDNKFVFVRRIDGGNGKIEYEVIRYERTKKRIVADLFITENNKRKLAERCTYLSNSAKAGVNYSLQVFHELWCKFIRSKIYSWGIDRMEGVLATFTQQKNMPASI